MYEYDPRNEIGNICLELETQCPDIPTHEFLCVEPGCKPMYFFATQDPTIAELIEDLLVSYDLMGVFYDFEMEDF